MLPCASRCNWGTIAATPEERLRGVSHVPRGSVPLSLLILAVKKLRPIYVRLCPNTSENVR